MTTKIHYVQGCSAASLSAAQQRDLRTLVESAPDMLALHVHPTIEVQNDQTNGVVMYFPLGAPVDATLISDRLWESLALSRVRAKGGLRGADPDDAHFVGKPIVIEREPPVAERAADSMRDTQLNADVRPWRAELGGPGAFAGAFYVPVAEDHRQKHYYLAARGTVPQLVHDLKQAIAREAPTYKDLLAPQGAWAKRMHYGAYVANRNVQRNLVSVAAACQVSIKRMDDVGSALLSPDHAPPERAIPDFQQTTHSIVQVMYEGKPAAALFCGVVLPNMQAGVYAAYVAAEPAHGIYAFPMAAGVNSPLPSSLPSSHKNANSVKPALKAAGWNPEQHVALMVPLTLMEY